MPEVSRQALPLIVCAVMPSLDVAGPLEHRYGADYDVVSCFREADVGRLLQQAGADGRAVALVMRLSASLMPKARRCSVPCGHCIRTPSGA